MPLPCVQKKASTLLLLNRMYIELLIYENKILCPTREYKKKQSPSRPPPLTRNERKEFKHVQSFLPASPAYEK